MTMHGLWPRQLLAVDHSWTISLSEEDHPRSGMEDQGQFSVEHKSLVLLSKLVQELQMKKD